MAENKEDLEKVELPRIWQIIQLWSVQSLAGSLASAYFLTQDWVSKSIIKGLGTTPYGIILGSVLVIGAISCWGAGTAGMQFLLSVIKQIKLGKNE